VEYKIEGLHIQDLVPPVLSRINAADTVDQLIFCGASTISWMIFNCKKELWQRKKKIKEEQARKDVLNKSKSESRKRANIAIRKLNDKKFKIELAIRALAELGKKARKLEIDGKKPRLSVCRDFNHFFSGEKIKLFDGKCWVDVEISNGHEQEKMFAFVDIGGLNYFPKNFPGIVKISEFEFLKNHSEFARLWVRLFLLFDKDADLNAIRRTIIKEAE